MEWRRSKVVELRARGLTQLEIAQELQVSKASISSDMQYLREQAKGTIKEYATKYLPEQYQVYLTALYEIIKRIVDILENSHDNREKLQPMELFKDTHLVKLELLLSNATTIDSALNYIRNKQQEHKRLTLDSSDNDDSNNNSDDDNDQLNTTTCGRLTIF